MTDSDLVAKKLAFIETCVRELKTLSQPDRLNDDLREKRFVEHTLQIAIQAALDVASHIVSDERLGEPRTNRELFDLMEKNGCDTRSQDDRELTRGRLDGIEANESIVHGSPADFIDDGIGVEGKIPPTSQVPSRPLPPSVFLCHHGCPQVIAG